MVLSNIDVTTGGCIMQYYELWDFLDDFLDHQNLSDFRLTFEAFNAHRPRRAKRSTAMIQAKEPSGKTLPNSATVKDLFDRLYQLAPESKEWVDSKRYVLRMYDDRDERVKAQDLLGDLRIRSSVREKEGEKKVQVKLQEAIQYCENIVDGASVTKILSSIVFERLGK
jgi:hypothetical protein